MESIEINGKHGLVTYFDSNWQPVDSKNAVMAKVILDDGQVGFYSITPQ